MKSCLESCFFHVCNWSLLWLQKGKSEGSRGNGIVRTLGKKGFQEYLSIIYACYTHTKKGGQGGRQESQKMAAEDKRKCHLGRSKA